MWQAECSRFHVVDQQDSFDLQFRCQLAGIQLPGNKCPVQHAIHHRAGAAKTCRRKISIERRAGQFGSARFEVVQNIFKGLLRVFACGIALAGDQLQLISILCEQAEIAFGAAEIASENHWSHLPAVIAVLLAVTFHAATCKRGGPLAALLS